MVNQKLISFKISFQNLEDIDNCVKDSSRWTTRNEELNRAVEMYVMYERGREALRSQGDPELMREFVSHYLSQNE